MGDLLKAPKQPTPDPAAQVETLDESAKRATLLEQRKKQTGASSTLMSNPNTFGNRQTLG